MEENQTPSPALPKKKGLLRKSNIAIVVFGIAGVWMVTMAIIALLDPEDEVTEIPVAKVEKPKNAKELLLSGQGTDREKFRAIMELGRQGDPFALDIAHDFLGADSSLIRAGAADAAGRFDDPRSLDVLNELISDTERHVRVRAIRAIAYVDTPERRSILEQMGKHSDLTNDERIEVQAALSKMRGTADGSQKAIDELVKIATSGNKAEHTRAAFRAASLSPENEAVVKMLRKKVHKRDSQVMPVAIRHLAGVGDPWLKKYIGDIAQTEDKKTLKAVLSAIPMICPHQPYSLVNKVLQTSPDPEILRICLDTVKRLGGKQALNLYRSTDKERLALADPKLAELLGENEEYVRKHVQRRACL